MTGFISAAIDTGALFEVVVASLVASIGTTLAFSLAIVGAARSTDSRRGGRTGAATAYALLAAVALAGSAAVVAIGIVVMAFK